MYYCLVIVNKSVLLLQNLLQIQHYQNVLGAICASLKFVSQNYLLYTLLCLSPSTSVYLSLYSYRHFLQSTLISIAVVYCLAEEQSLLLWNNAHERQISVVKVFSWMYWQVKKKKLQKMMGQENSSSTQKGKLLCFSSHFHHFF